MQSVEIESGKCFNQQISAYIKHKSQFTVKLKAVEKIMGFSLLLYFQFSLLILDFQLSNLRLFN